MSYFSWADSVRNYLQWFARVRCVSRYTEVLSGDVGNC